jgi:hypothetical protein
MKELMDPGRRKDLTGISPYGHFLQTARKRSRGSTGIARPEARRGTLTLIKPLISIFFIFRLETVGYSWGHFSGQQL